MIPIILGILSNKTVQRIGIYGLAIGAIFMSGFFFRGSCEAKEDLHEQAAQAQEQVEVLQNVITVKDKLKKHYDRIPRATRDELSRVLSGHGSSLCPQTKLP